MRDINNITRSDISFLGSHHIMDYSLLLVIETNPAWLAAKEARVLKRQFSRKQMQRNSEDSE
jgi:hypothetical protein